MCIDFYPLKVLSYEIFFSSENLLITFSIGADSVLDPGKGVCTDPRGEDATLGQGGARAPSGGLMSVS
jgi:hypothetical protein